jgi:abortive infection bacteriophage resistance protein
MKYTKPPLSYHEQADLLQSRGLIISNTDYAVRLLERIGYYRLSAYGLPFQSQKDKFNDQTKIEDIERLYDFDRGLRNIYLTTVSRVEIPLRTRITYYLAHKFGPFGYLSGTNFSKYFNHTKWLSSVEEEIDRSKELFIQHFRQKYQKDSPGLPIWMLTEVMSFGSLSLLFSGLIINDQSIISKEFSIHPKVLKSWLHCLVYTRNICAHHARLWNRTLGIKPLIPRKVKEWQTPVLIDNDKVFSVFTIANCLLSKLSPGNDLRNRLMKLFDDYPYIDKSKMGFVTDWESHELWK